MLPTINRQTQHPTYYNPLIQEYTIISNCMGVYEVPGVYLLEGYEIRNNYVFEIGWPAGGLNLQQAIDAGIAFFPDEVSIISNGRIPQQRNFVRYAEG